MKNDFLGYGFKKLYTAMPDFFPYLILYIVTVSAIINITLFVLIGVVQNISEREKSTCEEKLKECSTAVDTSDENVQKTEK